MSSRVIAALGSIAIAGGAYIGASAMVQAEQSAFGFEAFHTIQLSEGIELSVVSGAERYLVTAEASGLTGTDRLQITQDGQVLAIDRTDRWSPMGGLLDGPLRVTVHLPELRSLSVHEGAIAEVTGAVAQEVEFDVTSGSRLRISDLDAAQVYLEASSGGDLEVSGRCVKLDVTASSGGDIDAEDLHCKTVRASASSGADVDLTATGQLRAKASSGGDISVEGNPATQDVSHSVGGSVRIKG
ncbi:head GIN domain-containing protein [Epibacterium sp. Ofav1-8]|uniref:head GIN domain-containing protein n=1 Tax=Epibacterium sp. Ofav1-8 TaxID=2917735 RepID=UPI001EF5783A|nr:head GIN domain-containing protein [Epibacterium sp. Ofav1-8]MCG7622582.1 DUF2807 domain-containing protein [Epibacterium sp. Ofav1-8]